MVIITVLCLMCTRLCIVYKDGTSHHHSFVNIAHASILSLDPRLPPVFSVPQAPPSFQCETLHLTLKNGEEPGDEAIFLGLAHSVQLDNSSPSSLSLPSSVIV